MITKSSFTAVEDSEIILYPYFENKKFDLEGSSYDLV